MPEPMRGEASGPAGAPIAVSDVERRLQRYLDLVDQARGRDERSDPSTPLLRRIGKRLVPAQRRLKARLVATVLLAPRERRRARALARGGPVRLHLGSGTVYKQGWVNVDLAGDRVDLAWDLTKPLPFEDGVVDAIFHEHFLELQGLSDALASLKDCRRVLRPGGVLRFGVPDAWPTQSAFADQLDGDPPLPRLLAMQEIFYYPGVQAVYDFETLELMLTAAGFESIERSEFGSSRISPCPDTESRRGGTIYVEAVR